NSHHNVSNPRIRAEVSAKSPAAKSRVVKDPVARSRAVKKLAAKRLAAKRLAAKSPAVKSPASKNLRPGGTRTVKSPAGKHRLVRTERAVKHRRSSPVRQRRNPERAESEPSQRIGTRGRDRGGFPGRVAGHRRFGRRYRHGC